MPLLIDTDAFWKLGLAELLQPAAKILGVEWKECYRLTALPHMLRSKKLVQRFGQDKCKELAAIAKELREIPAPAPAWIDLLTGVHDIDPGEALLLARAAETGDLVLTGDKRALKAAKAIQQIIKALTGKVVIVEAIYLKLCKCHGEVEIRKAVQPVREHDTVLKICFANDASSAYDSLKSYFDHSVKDLEPLTLWSPY